MKVFLDVGAHVGETLYVARETRWGFDRIVCFEPAPSCWPRLEALADKRVELCRFGLWKTDDTIVLNNPGQVGASISADKDQVLETVACEFRDAARWFEEHVSRADEVFAKINIEGAEADVIDRLASGFQLDKIDHLLLHFDVRKIPSLRDREPAMRLHLAEANVEYLAAEEIQFGAGAIRGTRNWLRWCHGNPRTRDLRFKTLSHIEFLGRRVLYPLKDAVMHDRRRGWNPSAG